MDKGLCNIYLMNVHLLIHPQTQSCRESVLVKQTLKSKTLLTISSWCNIMLCDTKACRTICTIVIIVLSCYTCVWTYPIRQRSCEYQICAYACHSLFCRYLIIRSVEVDWCDITHQVFNGCFNDIWAIMSSLLWQLNSLEGFDKIGPFRRRAKHN